MIGRKTTKWTAASCPFLLALFVMGCQHTPPALYEVRFDTEPAIRVLAAWNNDTWTIHNGPERIELARTNDSTFQVPVFDGSWVGTWVGGEFQGVWTDSLRPGNYRIPFQCVPVANQPETGPTTTTVWQTSEGTMTLRQRGDSLSGTIATPTGDYRHLFGQRAGSEWSIHTFDGAHLFGFFFETADDLAFEGTFLSGNHYRTAFSGSLATTNDEFENSYSIDCQDFVIRFTDESGGDDSLVFSADTPPMVVDIMGTWCPNCMDEARLIQSLRDDHPDVPVVSLAYERSEGKQALDRIASFAKGMGIGWDVLHAGPASKSHASNQFPCLDGVKSFPTTIFWGGPSDVVVHSGFKGPATGEGYDEERLFFEQQFERLSGLKESR